MCGIPTTRGTLRNEGRCDQAGIAEPDNVVPILHQGQLIIGEDTNEQRVDSMCECMHATLVLCCPASNVYMMCALRRFW